MINLGISLLSIIVGILFARSICKLFNYDFTARNASRLGGIDGLRGYLAIGVLFNHFTITYQWKTEGVWNQPPESYFTTFGQIGVSLFFMITGYLFIYKLLTSPKINWKVLYLSRFFRIMPLYFFAVFLVFATVAYQTSFTLYETPAELIHNTLRWLIFQDPNINQLKDTKHIVSAVFWTLRYEWLFYLSLPFIAFFLIKAQLKVRVPLMAIIILISLYSSYTETPFWIDLPGYDFSTAYAILFLTGGLTAVLRTRDYKLFHQYVNHPVVSLIIIASLFTVMFAFDTAYGLPQVLMLAAFFIPVALGNTLFGFLQWNPSIFLGEISYSLYLLHGFVLYLFFSILFPDFITEDNRLAYMLLMPVMTFFTILMSWATYSTIEKPMISIGRMVGKKYFVNKPVVKSESFS